MGPYFVTLVLFAETEGAGFYAIKPYKLFFNACNYSLHMGFQENRAVLHYTAPV